MKLFTIASLSACMVLAFSAVPCHASAIQLGIVGDAQIGSNYIDFGQFPSGAPYTPAPGYGTFMVSLVNPGVFATAGVTTGETGLIQSLNSPPGNISLPTPFMTFNAGGSNISLWATNMAAGNAGPYFLTDTPNGAVASFNVSGTVADSSNPSLDEVFTGTFSMTFNGTSVAQLFTSLPINTPFSGTFTAADVTPTPEPGSFLLIGAGLLGAGVISRRKARKA